MSQSSTLPRPTDSSAGCVSRGAIFWPSQRVPLKLHSAWGRTAGRPFQLSCSVTCSPWSHAALHAELLTTWRSAFLPAGHLLLVLVCTQRTGIRGFRVVLKVCLQERAMRLDAGCSAAPQSESCQMLHPTGPTLPAGLCSPWKKAECRGQLEAACSAAQLMLLPARLRKRHAPHLQPSFKRPS